MLTGVLVDTAEGPGGLPLTPTAYTLPAGTGAAGAYYFRQRIESEGVFGIEVGELDLRGYGVSYGVTDRLLAALSALEATGTSNGLQVAAGTKYRLLSEREGAPVTLAAGGSLLFGSFALDMSWYLAASRRILPGRGRHAAHLHAGLAYDHGDFRGGEKSKVVGFAGLDVRLLPRVTLTADLRGRSIRQERLASSLGLHWGFAPRWSFCVGMVQSGVAARHELYLAIGHAFGGRERSKHDAAR